MEIFENIIPCCNHEEPIMPYPCMPNMPCHDPLPMPCPPMPSMPCYDHMPMPYPPMHPNPMPAHPCPMPPMPDHCDDGMMQHMERMYCMHMYMAAMNEAEAYRNKMMLCSCRQQGK